MYPQQAAALGILALMAASMSRLWSPTYRQSLGLMLRMLDDVSNPSGSGLMLRTSSLVMPTVIGVNASI